MLSLLASRLVGPQGCVDAFEPNPECCTRIEHAIRENAIGNIRIQRVGLADRSGTMQLEVPCVNPGEGTLAGSPYPSSEVRSLVVRVVTGDELILDGGSPPALIKIDVEGFECRVIDGLQRTLSEHRPPVVTEVVRAHLGRAGESVHTLFARMHDLGYEAYALGTVRRLFRHRLELHPVDASTLSASTDVLWVHASRVHPVIERLLLRSPT
jgi:FkbM family methyltransferase